MSKDTTRVQCKCGRKFRVNATGAFHCNCPDCGKRLSVGAEKKTQRTQAPRSSSRPPSQRPVTPTVTTSYATSASQTASRQKKKLKKLKHAKKKKKNFKSQAQIERESQQAWDRYRTVVNLLLLRRILQLTLIPLVCLGILAWFVIDTMILGNPVEPAPKPKLNLPVTEIPGIPPLSIGPNTNSTDVDETVRRLIDNYPK